MKFFVINSFRLMVYLVYPAFILYCGFSGWLNAELFFNATSLELLATPWVSALLGLFMGWIVATLVAGLIVTLLDIRDDVNDLLKIVEDEEE